MVSISAFFDEGLVSIRRAVGFPCDRFPLPAIWTASSQLIETSSFRRINTLFLHELEVNASAEVLVYYEDSIGHLRSLVGVVEQLIFVIEQLSREFMAFSNLLDLSNQNFILLLNENEDWLFHFSF